MIIIIYLSFHIVNIIKKFAYIYIKYINIRKYISIRNANTSYNTYIYIYIVISIINRYYYGIPCVLLRHTHNYILL